MKDRFSTQSGAYAQFRPHYPKILFDDILKHVPYISRQAAWDCATGNGQAAKVLANYFKKVYATDISQKQLGNAFISDNIIYSIGKAEDSVFDPNMFDLITVAQAIHWFDFENFYAEAKRVAKPNAIVAIWGYGTLSLDYQPLNTLFWHFYNHTIATYWDTERRHIDAHYKTVPFPFRIIETPQYEMVFKWNRVDFEGYLNTWSSVQNFQNKEGYNPVTNLMHDIRKYWKDGIKHTVRFPIFMTIGRVENIQ